MMFWDKFTSIATALFVAGLTALPLSVFAETASQVTQPSYAPEVTSPAQGSLDLPATSNLTAPAGADTLFVTPSGLTVEGQLPELQAETTVIEASIKDQRVSGRALFAAAQALEAAYVKAGYLLARVTLPPQTIVDGMALKLIVTLGYVESIDATAFEDTARRRIEAVLQPLVGNRALTNRELERRLLLAGDIPGVLMQSTLKAGEEKGGTVIVVDGRANPISFNASFDNSLSDGLGNNNASFGANFNNMLGLGEVGYVQLGGYWGTKNGVLNSDPRNLQVVAGMTLPLSTNGLWFNLEGVDSQTHPTSDLSFTMLDEYQRFATKLGYNWIRSRHFNTSSEIGFGMSNETQKVETSTTRSNWTQDKLRVLRFTQNADLYTTWGSFISGNATVSFGLDRLGARQGTTALPMSRSGAEPDFSKLELSGHYSQGLADNQVQWSVAVKGQTSFGHVMASSEQFGLGGFDGLSAFDGGALMGDSGAMVRTELTWPLVLPAPTSFPSLGAAVAPYVFGAAGFTKLENATALENATNHANAFGLGLRFGVSQKASSLGTTLTLEYAHGNQDNGSSDNRFNLRWLAQF